MNNMAKMIDDLLDGLTPNMDQDERLSRNIDIRQAVAAEILADNQQRSDPKMMALALKALSDSDKVTLTQQRNLQDKEANTDANARVSEMYKILVEQHGKRCISPEDIAQGESIPTDKRTDTPLEVEGFSINKDELIIGMDTSDAMDTGEG